MKIKSMIPGLAALLFIAQPASAIEPLSAQQLHEVCVAGDEGADANEERLCVYFVKGFLDGAVATDGRVAENVVAEISSGNETFSQRAIRTRVIDRIQRYGPSVYAKFCVGQPDPIADVVQHVIEELDRYDSLEGVQAQTVVYSSLKRHYPCEVD